MRVDYDEFRRLWEDQTITKGQICERLGITRWRLADVARILDLDDDDVKVGEGGKDGGAAPAGNAPPHESAAVEGAEAAGPAV